MKKTLAAIALAMMSILFAGCDKGKEVEPDRDLANKIVGKWMVAETDSKVLPTNEKIVYEFVSATKAYVSLSFTDNAADGNPWTDRREADVDIVGNNVTLTHSPEPGKTVVVDLHVDAITGTTMIGKRNVTVRKDGGLVKSDESMIRCEKVDVDYSKNILGLWEGKMTSDQSAFDDGQEHRWEFKEDGTFVFYIKNSKGIWEAKDDEFSQWFVAGKLLCTRWKNAGEGTVENREWWEIRSIEEDTMIWTALRKNELGEQYVESFVMHKVPVPTADEIMQRIKATKWMTEKINGEVALTNEKAVFTFFSRTQATISATFEDASLGVKDWAMQREFDYVIENNIITFTCKVDENTSIVDEMIVGAIDDENLHCLFKRTVYEDGRTLPYPSVNLELRKQEKTPVNYGSYILGTWEGRATSDHSQYDDGQVHRWKYEGGFSFTYYVKDGDNWVPSSNTLNEYFVDGRLLFTRWVDNGVEYREWWEIMSLDDQTMIWGAIRQDEYGQRYPASFALTRIEYWKD